MKIRPPPPAPPGKGVVIPAQFPAYVTLRLGTQHLKQFAQGANLDQLIWLRKNVIRIEDKRFYDPLIIKAGGNPGEIDKLASFVTRKVNCGSSAGEVVDGVATTRNVGGAVVSPSNSALSIGEARLSSERQVRFAVSVTELFERGGLNRPESNGQPETPQPQSAVRTPTLKFRIGGSAASTPGPRVDDDLATPSTASANKKRKRLEEGAVGAKPPPVRKISLITSQPASTKHVLPTPGIKLKTKGKIPKRPLGVGYDSELDDRENDPVILEAFVLRMQPGDDCDYVRDAITKGTVGVSRLQGGADIRLRFLDSNGRRGVMFVRGNQYAVTLVDLPTITEGMKSWDKKNFMKSVDVSQICLVLGRCNTDDEARNYPLPADINPKNYQYAHGLTPPMHNVRKRRFERTARTRVDDIEAIERKVNALLKADADSFSSTFDVLDYDPRNQRDEFSPEYDSEDDAEGEEDGYFPRQHSAMDMDTPNWEGTPAPEVVDDIGADEIEDFERMMMEGADSAPTAAPAALVGDADVAASPAGTSIEPSVAPTPAADADIDGDDDDDDDAEEDEDADQEQREGNEQRIQALDRIKETQAKIQQNRETLKKTGNAILRKKIAKKITDLESDIAMMKRQAGIKDDDGEGDADE